MKLKNTEGYKTFLKGMWKDHPIFSMVLGICSALAVSNKVEYAVAMGAGVTFVLIASGLLISSIRKIIPTRGRIIIYMLTISTFVIVVDRIIKAFFPEIGEAIGPYIGLIITNCIIMGRAEAFFVQNRVHHSIIDGLSNGLSYSYTLISIAVIRELLGFGTILGFKIMPDFWTNWVVLAMAPGAFFVLTVILWISRTLSGVTED